MTDKEAENLKLAEAIADQISKRAFSMGFFAASGAMLIAGSSVLTAYFLHWLFP